MCESHGAHTHNTSTTTVQIAMPPTGQVKVTPDGGEMQDRHVYIGYVRYNALNACYKAYNVRWNT